MRARTREWRASLESDPRLHHAGIVPPAALPGRSAVRAELFVVG